MASITQLERSAEIFSGKLNKMCISTKIDIFRCGKGGASTYGASFVEIECFYLEEYKCTVRFVADGYYSYGDGVFYGRSFKQMKRDAMEYIEKEIPEIVK